MRTHNICFCEEIINHQQFLLEKNVLSKAIGKWKKQERNKINSKKFTENDKKTASKNHLSESKHNLTNL